MGTDVEYRDLPGGNRKIRFADELPHRMVCATCGMLSMEMYQDEQGHAFCHVCVTMQSPAAAIFCKYENRDVPLDQLHDAFDIIGIIKDQVVFCPNENHGCTAYSSLQTIEDHFLRCEKTKLLCMQCQQHVKGINWKKHMDRCPRKILECRYCITAFPQIDLQTHEAVCAENSHAVRSLSSSSSTPVLSSPRPEKSAPQNVSVDEHAECCDPTSTSSDSEDGIVEIWRHGVPHCLRNVLAYLNILGDNPFVAFLQANQFVRSFVMPFLGIVVVALCIRRRNR